MGEPNTTCRVCGRGYFCCADSRAANSWRAVACSPECYREYMRRILESREPHTTAGTAAKADSMEAGADSRKPDARKKKAGTGETKKEAD